MHGRLVIAGPAALLFAGTVFAIVTAQAETSAADLDLRYIKACINAGDTEAYCRCELPISRNLVPDAELEAMIRINELPNDRARKDYLEKMPAAEVASILRLAQLVNNAAFKQCPDVRKQT